MRSLELDDEEIAHRLACAEGLRSKSTSPVMKGKVDDWSNDEQIALLIRMFESSSRRSKPTVKNVETTNVKTTNVEATNVEITAAVLPTPTRYQRKQSLKQCE
jgi:hypothetical protein